ncbi:MAG: hypothetical protein IJJ23_05905 [Clostridia bacterium]|nr:hypothetical protein [Clostridia bacterium]
MKTENGEWIMKGCDPSSPDALRSPDDAKALIRDAGFMPLFSNDIAGFSIEEHVPASAWWSGDGRTDPWEWRMILAREPDIAYGKFFGRAAGFVSRDFFPTLANYRRDGYDFDALFEDELASYRSKKIMDAFELDEEAVGRELMTSDLRHMAGFGRDGGEKNFEGCLTDLQMQTYLIIGDFRQKVNKQGGSYGWHIAVVETPETKWGRDFVTSAYSEKPGLSWRRIAEKARQIAPHASDEALRRILGIRRSYGETA